MEKYTLPSPFSLKIVKDKRGELCFAEEGKEIPFSVKRVFWISNVPNGETRGGHANWSCSEVIFAVAGSFQITLDNGTTSKTFLLTAPNQGIEIPAGVWCVLHDFQENTVCCVVADQEYSSEHYVNDYQSYIQQVQCK